MTNARGNIFTILLSGIVLSGALSVSLYQLMGGTVFSTVRLAKKTATEAQIQNAARILISLSGNQTLSPQTNVPGDCDADGFVEPPPFRAAATWAASEPEIHPVNGGLLPLDTGAAVTDAWGTDIGYCVWDVGAKNNPVTDSGCGAAVRRLSGAPNPVKGENISQTVVALISAGPDKRFQTACQAYVDETTPVLVQPVSDDIVIRFSYAEAALATASLWSLKKGTPEKAATAGNLSIGTPGSLKALSASSPVASLSISTTGKTVAGAAAVLGRQTTVADGMCDAAHVGLLRYNTTANAGVGGIQFCNPGGWATASFPGGPMVPNPGNRDHIDVTTGGLLDGAADYSTRRYLGLGLGALNISAPPTGAAAPVPKITQGPSRLNRVGANAATVSPTATVSGQTYAMDGAGGRLSAPSAGGTVVVQVSSTNATGANSLTVTDSIGNTYIAARAATGCASNRGTAGIYFRTYAASPGAITLTVRPSAFPASLSWTVTEYANINAGNAASVVDLSAQDVSSATGVASSSVAAAGTTALSDELALGVLTRCPAIDTSSTPLASNASGSNPPRWMQIYDQVSDPAAGSQYAVGSAVAQIFPGAVTAPAHVWSFGSAGATAPAGHVSVLATLKPVGAAAVQPVNAVGVGYRALGSLTTGANNTAFGHNALSALTSGVENVALGQGAMSVATTASQNVAIGRAMGSITTGFGNTAMGNSALSSLVSGGANTAVGYQAGASVTGTSEATAITAIGSGALASQVAAAPQTAFGHNALALANAPAGDGANTAVGAGALSAVVTGKQSVAVGTGALALNTADNNTAVGYNALAANTTGTGNTGFGARALAANTTGGRNTAFGEGAIAGGAGTSSHTAFGASALAGGDTANSGHTAFGASAMSANQSSQANTAFGSLSLGSNTTGSFNVAIGSLALGSGTTPSAATAVGMSALRFSTVLDNPEIAGTNDAGNSALGYQALASNANGFGNTAAGYATLSNSTGSRNTAIGAQALWAINNAGNDNTAIGSYSLSANTSGSRNTAAGYESLTLNTTGNDNSAVGHRALPSNTVGSQNTALGAFALNANSAGSDNTAAGAQALSGNISGSQNTAEGYQSLSTITTGTGNTARGYKALQSTTANSSYNTAYGSQAANSSPPGDVNFLVAFGAESMVFPRASANVSAGYRAMYNGCGSGAVAIGDIALYSCVNGTGQTAVGYRALTAAATSGTAANTAVGAGALSSNTTGTGNTAVGKDALRANVAGVNNTAIGHDAGPSPTNGCGGLPCTNLTNTLAVGYQAYTTQSNTVRLGNMAITQIRGGVLGIQKPSDRRLKKDIEAIDLGLDFVMGLEPVSYRLISGNGRLDYGFIAQDVSRLLGTRKTNLVLQSKDARRTWHLASQEMIAPLVKTIQEQQKIEDKQKQELKRLRRKLDALMKEGGTSNDR